MEELKYSILKVLTYFDIFNYPLLPGEISFFLDRETPPENLSQALGTLVKEETIFYIEGYFTLHNDVGLIQKRIDENKRAAELLPKAKLVSNLLYYFPFVRAVGISGSLSKNVADPQADFDYFIITKANRLWISRTLLMLLRRCSALVGKEDWFCLNYFIDECCLQIPEQNIYTATELLTLIITKNNQTGHLFLDANNWVYRYYPHYQSKKTDLRESESTNLVKKAIESVLDISLFNRLDNWIMDRSAIRLKNKKMAGRLLDLKGREVQLPLIDKHYCKPNPYYFQTKVLGSFTEKLNATLQKS
jgi:hypothetical protein